MSESVIDFAGLDSAATTMDTTTETVETTPVETTETTETTTPTETTETTEGGKKEGKQQYNSDGSPKEDEAVKTKAEDLTSSKDTTDGIRKLLKSMRDADPNNAAAVKQLHGAFERYQAFAKVFPKVSDAQQAKEFIDLVGGHEGYESIKGTVESAEASDQQLYSGDPQLIQNIVEDLKGQGKLDALGKLAPSFLDALKEHDAKGYIAAVAPHTLAGLESANLPGALNALVKTFTDKDLESADPAIKSAAMAKALASAKAISEDIHGWYKNLDAENKKAKDTVVSPERQKLEEDRKAFLKQQEEFKTNQTKEFQNSVAKSCESVNNKTLGASLASYLKMPFFKGYGKENLMPLGNTLKSELYATLKSDNAYQAQMKALWGAKTPDRAKIEEYHKARVASISDDLVRGVVQKMYPGYTKGGAAAGRVAAAADKKEAVTKVENKAAATGKPIYVATKPAWDSIDFDKDPKQLNYIMGRAYLKGSGKYVTWRKN